ncbi:MAG: PP2C family protein-serine/threonine phosphatase [Chloroflexota bacterium]
MSINHGWSLTKKEKQLLDSLGKMWLDIGASRFGFILQDRIVFEVHQTLNVEKGFAKASATNGSTNGKNGNHSQSSHAPDFNQCITAEITLNELHTGKLFVEGVENERYQRRLTLDAGLISSSSILQTHVQAISAELVEKQDQLVSLYQLSQTMRRHLEIQPLFSSLIRTLQTLFHTETVITLVSSGGLSPIVSAYPDNSILNGDIIQMLQEMHATEDAEIMNHGVTDRIRNILFLPLHVKEPFHASFVFANKIGMNFTSSDLSLAQLIGEQVSAQFEYVQLHQELLAKAKLEAEAEMAKNVQMQLLPSKPPQIPGLDLFAQSLPASQVGGDFYVFMPDAIRPLFVLGDVSGKGMPAALLMTMLRSSFKSAARVSKHIDQLTVDVLNDVNHSMYGDFTSVEMFATGIVVSFDPETRLLSYSNAGHSPVIYCPAEGDPEILPANGPAMGVVDMEVAGKDSLTLNPDDLFIICTDGFNEAWNEEGEMYGYDRLLDLISSIRHCSAMEIAIEMYMAIENFSGRRQQDDDQTLIVTKGVDHGA